jgi:hypothetical protein
MILRLKYNISYELCFELFRNYASKKYFIKYLEIYRLLKIMDLESFLKINLWEDLDQY